MLKHLVPIDNNPKSVLLINKLGNGVNKLILEKNHLSHKRGKRYTNPNETLN